MAGTRERTDVTETCPYCGKGRLAKDPSRNTTTCQNCGAYFDKGILYRNPLDTAGTRTYRLRKWQQRIRVENAAERNLAFAFSELDRLSTENGLPRAVKESSSAIYRKAIGKNIIRGRSTESVVAASVYLACRQNAVPRTLDEISETSGVGKKELGRTFRFLSKELKLNLLPARPQDYVKKYSEGLGMSQTAQDLAVKLLDEASERELLSGLGPSGVAAAAIYMAATISGEHRSQREVSEAAEISEVTLRCRYKKLAESLGIKLEFP